MPLPFKFDFKNPDYNVIWEWRAERYKKLLMNPNGFYKLKSYYKENIAQFIIDWGCTSDPRNVEMSRPTIVPFLLFEKQEQWVSWFLERWKNKEPGISEKSREVGLTWLAGAVSSSVCLFNKGVVVKFGSRTEDCVDGSDNPDTIFWKIRKFTSLLPSEFTNNWTESNKTHSSYLKIKFPGTDSIITGQSSDNMGRGGRSSFYFVDEAAFIMRPNLSDAAISANTNCRIDISTPNGNANSFAQKRRRFSAERVFTVRWQDDPRKDQAWYDKKCTELDPIVVAQELDLDYSASVEGVLIPMPWIMAAIDAHIKLNIEVCGIRRVGFDVADEGRDKNALCARHGILIEDIEEWSGKGSDIYKSVEKVYLYCEEFLYRSVYYDADGLGASVRGDATKICESKPVKIKFESFRGSGSVLDPRADPFNTKSSKYSSEKGRKNEDYFANFKAQSWFSLRQRFYKTYRAIVSGDEFDKDELISIPSKLKFRDELINELSQPTFKSNEAGKMIINKQPDNVLSPNKADAVMIAFSYEKINPRGL